MIAVPDGTDFGVSGVRYHHQYMGFTRGGKRLIYIVGSPRIDIYDEERILFEPPHCVADGGPYL